MKTFKFLVLPLLTVSAMLSAAYAQTAKQSGLYLTESDFIQHKLSYASPQDKLYIHEFLDEKSITVIENGQKISLTKDKVYGYRDAANHNYRFFKNAAYQIVDTAGFYLYNFEKLVQEGKGPKPMRAFYFSANASSELMPLQIAYVDNVFAKNRKFKNAIDAQLRTEGELASYDKAENEYKIKEIYLDNIK